MYTAEEFRQDLIANIKENNTFSPLVRQCEIKSVNTDLL